MAVTAFVDTDTLPTSNGGTVDLVSSGFGTVDAGVYFFNRANTTNNPQADFAAGIAFYDGTNDSSVAFRALDNLGASSTDRYSSTTDVYYDGALRYGVAATTDGVRITKNSGTTGISRYVSGVSFGGLTNAAS